MIEGPRQALATPVVPIFELPSTCRPWADCVKLKCETYVRGPLCSDLQRRASQAAGRDHADPQCVHFGRTAFCAGVTRSESVTTCSYKLRTCTVGPRGPHPTGNRAPAPTSTPPGARPQRRAHTSSHSTGSHAPAPTATRSGCRAKRRRDKSSHPTGNRAPAPTPTPPAPHKWRRMYTCSRPTVQVDSS